MIGILAVAALSYSYNQPGMLPAIFFVRQIFIFLLFFVALLNLDLSDQTVCKINRLVVFLFLIQLPAAAAKLLLVGQWEGLGIGTVSWQAGEFSTTLPLFAIAFILSFYFFRKDKKCLLLIAGFFLFGTAGKKRALALLIPVVSGVIWYLYGKREVFKRRLVLSVSQMKYFLVMCVIAFAGVFASSRLLNDEMYGGRFDIRGIVNYIIWYNTRDDIALYGADDTDYAMGRVTITRLSLKVLKEGGSIQQLIGFGPGAMIRSPHLGRENVAFEQFGFRGAVTGFVVLVLQVGFLGVLFVTLFFLNLFKRTYILYQRSPNLDYKIVALGFLGATFLFLLDFFVYSQSTLYFGVLTPVYFYIAAIVFRRDHHNFSIFKSSDNEYLLNNGLSSAHGKMETVLNLNVEG
jgi:hypothetical protein